VPDLKVFAFDYASGGGPTARPLPHALRRDGEMMLHALTSDLAALSGVELITMDDGDRQAAAPSVDSAAPFAQRFNACVQASDAVWPVAPVPGGLLEHLSREILRCKRILLGSSPAAVHVAASKQLTADTLARANIAAVATYAPHQPLPPGEGAWVVKPDDGAGCLDTRLFSDSRAALAWIESSGEPGYVLQPFIAGKVGSLSLLCCDGLARVLSCNEQRVAVHDNQFHFLGSMVNSLTDASSEFERMGQAVAAAMPGLWGYVGVDFILAEGGSVVLEVNPRVTTSYAGLHASIGCNPAQLVLALLDGSGSVPAAPLSALPVSVDVDAFGIP
jgi:predicted ATP-grasp superfamily ATP-dependent carboligase